MKTYKIIIALLISIMTIPVMAQSEGGLVLEAGAEKKSTRN